jgi:hypothetical protein
MEAKNGRPFITDQYAKLAHGKAVRDFPFIACSDSPFTEVCRPSNSRGARVSETNSSFRPNTTVTVRPWQLRTARWPHRASWHLRLQTSTVSSTTSSPPRR